MTEAILDTDLFGESPDTRSIRILQEFEPPEGYYLADSFGKDSSVLLDLAIRSGVKFDAHHSLTTIDPPELIQFGKKHHPGTVIDPPERSFWQYIRNGWGLPMRNARWCCKELKERGGEGRRVLTGVRAAESAKRAKQTMIQPCLRGGRAKHSSSRSSSGQPTRCGSTSGVVNCPTAHFMTRAGTGWAA